MLKTDFADDVVLVTGATAGFGAAIARRFHGAGARVIALGRRRERLDALALELGDRLLPIPFDLKTVGGLTDLISDLPEPFRNLTILVNNAGLGTDRGAAQEAALADWDEMVDLNIRALLHMTHHTLPGMLARGRGQIINIGSVAGRATAPSNAVYSATKSFVLQFSKALKSDLIATPVRVGSTRGNGVTARAAKFYDGFQPLSAEDVAEATFFTAAMPAHLDVTELELMPHAQGFGPRIFSKT